MHRPAFLLALIASFLFSAGGVLADSKKGKLPHVEFDVDHRQVRVECEALNVDAPLEFFCCVTGTNEHESVLRTLAKPSDIQIGLLALGLKPGRPMSFSEALNKWFPPEGPPVHINVEYEKDGKTFNYPASRWLRDIKTKKSPGVFTWVFAGSRVMPDGKFAADITGYVVSIVNFDLTLIDIPELKSSANETLEFERNPDLMPKTGTKVWMILEPLGGKEAKPEPGAKSEGRAAPGIEVASLVFPAGALALAAADAPPPPPTTRSVDPVHTNEKEVSDLKKKWREEVATRRKELQAAAEAHYKVISELQKEQHRLIDEADRIQRAIDELEKEYQDMTTPHPQVP
jgi:hypothetical protein